MPDSAILPARQERAVELLVGGAAVAEVAGEVGVKPSTVRRWRGDPAFRRALAAAEREAMDDLRRMTAATYRESVESARDAVRRGDKTVATRLALSQHLAATASGASPGTERYELEQERPDIKIILVPPDEKQKARARRDREELASRREEGIQAAVAARRKAVR